MLRNCSMLSFRCWHFNYRNNKKLQNNFNAQHFHVKHRISGAFRFFWQTWIPDVFLKGLPFFCFKKSWGDDVGWHRSPFTEKTIGHEPMKVLQNRDLCTRPSNIFQIWCSQKKSEGFIFCWSVRLVFLVVKFTSHAASDLRLKHENSFVEWILEYLPFHGKQRLILSDFFQ